MEQLPQVVARFIARHQLLQQGERVLLGLSGGADSVCLLRLLTQLGYAVEAAHANFQLRGEESDRDEQFCKQLCAQFAIPLHVNHFATAAYARAHQQSIEMAARDLRYDWFRRLAQEQGIRRIAVAHHRDDNIETLLLNLTRGAGLRGLCGMQPRAGDLIRPLLATPRAQILQHLGAIGQPYVTDSTNRSDCFARNRIRLHVLPQLQAINPAACDNIARTIGHLNEALRVYDYANEQFAAAALDAPDALDKASILRAPSPLSLLHTLLSPLGFRSQQLIQVLQHIHHVGAQFHSATHTLLIDRSQLLISDRAAPQIPSTSIPLPSEGETLRVPLPQGALILSSLEPPFHINPDPLHAFLDLEALRPPLLVRPPQTGDTFHPLGMNGSKLVSDFLTDQHLSRMQKQQQLLLLTGERIAWVIGLRIAHPFRITPSTQRALHLIYQP